MILPLLLAIAPMQHQMIAGSIAPSLAVADNGAIFVACANREGIAVGVLPLVDTCRQMGAQVMVGSKGVEAGKRRGPRIAIRGNEVVVTGQKKGDLLAWRSDLTLSRWEGPVRINDKPGSAPEGLHGLAAGKGAFGVVWLDNRSGAQEVYFSQSRDGGKSWATNLRAYRSPDQTVCECCHPSIVGDGNGFALMWRNWLGGNRDMYLSRTSDGSSFSPARKLDSRSWPLSACPMDGGALALVDGEPVAVWRNDKTVHRLNPARDTRDSVIATGIQPWAASGPGGLYTVYLKWLGGELWLQRPHGEPTKLTDNADDPVLTSSPNAKHVVAAWTFKNGIQIRRIAGPPLVGP